MLLKEITLHNFRQYKGTQNIIFSTDKEKNLTLIIGRNTCGKTTLVQSFMWALYGNSDFKKGELLNEELYEALKVIKPEGYTEDVYVRVVLKFGNTDYRITRSRRYIKKKTTIQKEEDRIEITYGDVINGFKPYTKNSKDLINQILPKEFSNYFFFWGERIESIDTNRNIKEAVSDFLGLSAIDNSRKHLKEIAKDYAIKLANIDKGDQNSAVWAIELAKLTEKVIPELYLEIENKKIDVENSEKRYHKYEQMLLDNAQVAEIQKSIKKSEIRVKSLEDKIKKDYLDLFKKFNQKPIGYFAHVFYDDILEVLDHIPDNEKGLAHQNEKSIMELINRGICVCGRPLEKNSIPYNHILKELEKIPPKSISSLAEEFRKEMKQRDNSNDYAGNVQDAYKKLRETEQELNDEINDLKENRSRIQDGQDKEIAKIQYEKDESFKRYNNYKTELINLQNELNNKENKAASIQRNIESREHVTEKGKEIQSYLDYTNAVIKDINDEYLDRETQLRNRLRVLVNEYFQKMYHGQREIIIDDDFKMKLISRVGNNTFSTEESPGLQTVKNFAFIAALVQIAKEKRSEELDSIENDEQIHEYEPYPLVLDAPFSQSDEIHVSNICKLISSVAEQTIMAIMEKDWKYAETIMHNKVGVHYELVKISETETIVRKVAE